MCNDKYSNWLYQNCTFMNVFPYYFKGKAKNSDCLRENELGANSCYDHPDICFS
jgi:hypothetical protein